MPVTWSDEKPILLYCPGRGSNSRPPAHRSFKHAMGKVSYALTLSATAAVDMESIYGMPGPGRLHSFTPSS